MQTTTQPNSISITQSKAVSRPWLMLISRSVLFLLFQALIALVFFTTGTATAQAWDESARWWTFIVSLANFVSIYLLVRLYNAEGKHFFDLLKFSRKTWRKDLLWFILTSIIGLPIMAVVKDPLAVAIFGDAMIPTNMLFLPLPTWAFVLSFLFPLTIAFAELPTYFAYCMPRLSKQINGWLAWLIASFFLAAQHMFLPLILDRGYLLWRFGMFIPFALFTGLVIKLRPALLPYFVIVHALLDVTTVLVYLMI
jgi:membrane protease YdiL (CAAX protease family)